MKKAIYTLLICLCIKMSVSQNAVSSWYTFSSAASTYTAITTGTLLGNNTNDDNSFNNINLGFTFNYAGTNYTQVAVNANGYLKMGSVITSSTTFPIDDSFGDDYIISAFGTDLIANTAGTLRYLTSGTSPNRIFTLQWSNYTTQFGTDNLNFQIKLYETTNKIDFIYGAFTPSQFSFAEVGLRGQNNNDFANRVVDDFTNTWATSTAGLNNYDNCVIDNGPPIFKPNTGQKYSWTPPPACSGTPPAGTLIASTGTTVCVGQVLNLSVTGSPVAIGLTYQWQSSPNGVTWTAVANATNSAFNPTYTANIYYRRVIACGTNTAATNGLNFVTTPGLTYTTVPFTENFDNTWQNRCDLRNVPVSAHWSSNPTTGDSSWRRQDDGISANWTTTNNIVTTYSGTGAANFHSYDAPAGTSGDLNLYVNMGGTQNYTVSFYHINTSGDDSLQVFLSTNGGATFTKKAGYKSGDYSPIDANWNQKTINLGAVNSTSCVIRFRGISDYGVDDIGIDNLNITAGSTCVTPTLNLASSSPSICSGSTATLTVSGAASYTWSTSSTATLITVSPSVTTVYSVTGSNGPGCTSTKTISVVVNPTPTVNAVASSSAICSGSNATLTASGATTYTWLPGSSTATTLVINPTVTTIYTLTGKSLAGCSNTKTVSLTVNPTPTVSVNNQTICPGGTATLIASGANTYLWNTAATSSVITVSPLTNTNYTVTGTSAGCSNTKTVSVTIGTGVTINIAASSTAICSGSSVSLTASGATTYTWNTSSNSTSIVVTPTTNTTYTVNGNSGSCSGTQTISVVVNPTPTVNAVASSASICSGSNATLTASGAATYTWLPGSSTATTLVINPTVTTIYTLTGKSLAGCSNTKTVSLTVNPTPTVSVNNQTICPGGTATLIASGANTYLWNTSATSSVITVSPLTNTNYTVTGTSVGCSNTKTVSVTIGTGVTINIAASSTAICSGSSVSLTASGATTYTWNTSSNSTSIVVTPTTNTTYTVNGNSGSCSGTQTISVVVNPTPTVNAVASSASICSGSNATLTASGAATYTWLPGSSTTTALAVSPSVTTVYTLTGQSAAGCSNTKTISLTVNPTPTVSVNNQTICPGGTATLIASGANTYLWNTAATNSVITVSPLTNTNYTVTGTSAGCSNTKTVSVTIGTGISINIAASSTAICSGSSVSLTASGATTYTWNTSSNSTSIVVTPTTNTTYTVNGNSGACSGTKTISILVNPTPTISISSVVSSSIICAGQSNTLSVSGANSYSWNTSSTATTIVISPTITTNYTVTGLSNGCSAVSFFSQQVSPCTEIEKVSQANNSLIVYPNPTSGKISVEVKLAEDKKIEVVDIAGRIMFSLITSESQNDIDISDLKNGIYFIKIVDIKSKTVLIKKVIKH